MHTKGQMLPVAQLVNDVVHAGAGGHCGKLLKARLLVGPFVGHPVRHVRQIKQRVEHRGLRRFAPHQLHLLFRDRAVHLVINPREHLVIRRVLGKGEEIRDVPHNKMGKEQRAVLLQAVAQVLPLEAVDQRDRRVVVAVENGRALALLAHRRPQVVVLGLHRRHHPAHRAQALGVGGNHVLRVTLLVQPDKLVRRGH